MNYSFTAEAQLEFHQAIKYYQQRRKGLGGDFADAVQDAIQRIVQNPESFAHATKSTKRCRTRRFPYDVIYRITEQIEIVAVMHLHRRPGYWEDRT